MRSAYFAGGVKRFEKIFLYILGVNQRTMISGQRETGNCPAYEWAAQALAAKGVKTWILSGQIANADFVFLQSS
jgi:hypothetical protein